MNGIYAHGMGRHVFCPVVYLFIVGVVVLICQVAATAQVADMARISLFDGERSEPINTWGGPFGDGTSHAVTIQSEIVCHGKKAAKIDLGRIPQGESRVFQMFASGFTDSPCYRQTRNLARFESLQFAMRNQTGAPLRVAIEVKDHRDSDDHRAFWWFTLGCETTWQHVEVLLAKDKPSWRQIGQPDFERVASLGFILAAEDMPAEGSVYLDDVALVEPGGPLPVDQTPVEVLVERLARRGWDAMWSARSREHGMIPNNSYQVADAGLNTTAAVLWMLPTAVRRGWVRSDEADEYVDQLLHTLNHLLDNARYLPPRNVDWVTLQPSLLPEESSVDTAFLSFALHKYKSSPGKPAKLCAEIDRVQNRFQFDAFAGPSGWKMAYRYESPLSREGFVKLTYDGYTNENKVISLAAHLTKRYHVDIATHWNTDVNRVREKLADVEIIPAVHSMREYRAPFAQALLNLFVDVRERGPDTFPDKAMATNPWANFVAYEQQVMHRLKENGRPWLVQPDAGDDGTLSNYQQFSLYEDFGQSDLFMPWSVAFALLTRVDRAEDAFRFLLKHGLDGPLGMADSARWATGDDQPYAVTARHDFWNTSLATMALIEYLEGEGRPSRKFASLPTVHEALNRVFPPNQSEVATAEAKSSQADPKTTSGS